MSYDALIVVNAFNHVNDALKNFGVPLGVMGFPLGVSITALISYLISKRVYKTEAFKFNASIENNIRKDVFDFIKTISIDVVKKRIELYPSVFSIASGISKEIEKGSLNLEQIKEFELSVSKIDSNISLFLGNNAVDKMYHFGRTLTKLANDGEELTSENIKDLESKCRKLELALKEDIYVFHIDSILLKKELNYYQEVNDEIHARNQETTRKSLLPNNT